MRRAQQSLQFIVVMAFVLAGFVLVLQLQNEGVRSYGEEAVAVHAQENLDYLASAIKAVWREGRGSQRQVRMVVPAAVPSSITGGTIFQTLPDASTIAVEPGVPLSGSLPAKQGVYLVRLVNNGTSVVISYG